MHILKGLINMSVCPRCGRGFKYKIIDNVFNRKSYQLKCDKCNSKIQTTKRTNKINWIIATVPLIVIVFYGEDIKNFITQYTKNNTISEWLVIGILSIWGIFIYNGKFPWTKF